MSPEQGYHILLHASLLAYCRIQAVYFTHGSVIRWIRRDDVDLVRIMLDAIQDRFRERTVIASQLIEPAIAIILRAKDGR